MYYNKVDISGVDTAKIKTLKEKEKIELLKKSQAGDLDSRDKLINGNLKLVLSVVGRFKGRKENLDDLFQVGCIGLIKAIDNFDLSLDLRFSTYAVPMVIGEIRRYLRDYSPVRVSRSLKDLAYKALKLKEELTSVLDREPTIEELAKQLDVQKHELVMALDSVVDPISLFEPVMGEGSETLYIMDQIGDSNQTDEWLQEIAIKQAIQNLTDREKLILSKRFIVGKTQVDVAKEIGISQAQVSRLEKNALDRIKLQISSS